MICFLTAVFTCSTFAQILIGPKVGGLYYKHNHDDKSLLKERDIKSNFDFGYNVGAVFIYSLNKRFAMQTEILYTVKGKKLTGGIQDQFSHEATYKYIEAPLLFKYNIKKKAYTWYIQGGANFSYWLSGKGVLKSFEFDEVGIPSSAYNIVFKRSEIDDESNEINLVEPNRIQVGLDFGVGALINTLHPRNKILVDLKYQFGHSWLARDNDILLGLDEYREDFRSSYGTFSLSVGYLFGFDLGQGKEGKSTSQKTRRPKKK